MPRLRLDPTAQNGVSYAPDPPAPKYIQQSNGYLGEQKSTGTIEAGSNITITGQGTKQSPYNISSSGGAGGGIDTANSPQANEIARFTDADTIEGRTAAEFKADLDLEIGTDLQAYSANLDEYATVNPTVAGLALLDDADAATQLATLGLTATATELNYTDGVTSAIQAQLDLKAPKDSPAFTGTVTLPTGLTGVVRADSGVVSVDSDVTDIVSAATTLAQGKVELATTAETDTGTDTGRVVTPDGLAGSVYGTKPISIQVIDGATTLTTGDGKAYFRIPTALNGMDLISASASVLAKSTSGTPTVQLARGRQANATTAHAFSDMLSTRITIDANEFDSKDAAAATVIDTAADDVLTGDLIRVDVDTAGTGTTGLFITCQFRTP